MTTRITVTHSRGAYDVVIGPGILARAGELLRATLGDRQRIIVTDTTLAARLAPWGIAVGDAGALTVPAGESAKSRTHWAELTDQLLARGLGRDGALVAVGGGSVGDLTGFVAATYLRGVPFVQVPTTLLAMLDASVGGKVAVDTPHGKNLVGAFHPPVLVLSDPQVLTSLPERDFLGGMAEAVKHGLVADAEYFEWIGGHATALRARDAGTLEHLIARSVEIKAAVVSEDEREEGRRAILNAGHTIAHGLEHGSGHAIPHGEAVALGLIAECAIADSLGVSTGLSDRVRAALTALGLPVRLATAPPAEAMMEAIQRDKKNRQGQVRLALLTAVGHPHRPDGAWTTPVLLPRIREALAAIS